MTCHYPFQWKITTVDAAFSSFLSTLSSSIAAEAMAVAQAIPGVPHHRSRVLDTILFSYVDVLRGTENYRSGGHEEVTAWRWKHRHSEATHIIIEMARMEEYPASFTHAKAAVSKGSMMVLIHSV
ncbi:hypothetical protein HDV63DRAFT_241762 [Trichoderma sp. SZMC 28014]